MNEIRTLLQKRRQNDQGGLAGYLMLGYPDYETSIEAMIVTAKNGADVIEIGIPFSDPIADGTHIQHAGSVAISNGIKTADTWEAIRRIRKETKSLPLLMTYSNIPMQYGYEAFAKDAIQAGARGIILPDMPPKSFPEDLLSLGPVYLASPLTKSQRLRKLVEKTTGFLYMVSYLGTTGENKGYDKRLPRLIAEVKNIDKLMPVMAGFGIKGRESAKEAMQIGLDGVVVGTSLIKALGNDGNMERLSNLVKDIVSGLEIGENLV